MGILNRIRLLSEIFLGKRSFSQEGEDMVLSDFFIGKSKGFYIDVGAHNPRRLSNTYLFYKRGWSGVNIDPVPGMKKIFDRVRPRDINIEVGVSKIAGSLKYYEFNEPALNGFEENLSKERDGQDGYRIVGTKTIKVLPLAEILEKHVPKGQSIDFMSIDAEGYDFEVIQSNDWQRFRPKVAIVELRKNSYAEIQDDGIYKYMCDLDYTLFAFTGRSCFFRSNI